MGKRLINVDEVEEIVPVLVGKLLENNLITEKQADQIICAIFNDNCPLKEQCNGLVKPECKEHISNEEACHAVDKMIEWYYQVEEPEFLKFYNCHLEMIK